MKNIYEILADYGLEIPEEKKADFDKAWKENYRTKAEYDRQRATAAKICSITGFSLVTGARVTVRFSNFIGNCDFKAPKQNICSANIC